MNVLGLNLYGVMPDWLVVVVFVAAFVGGMSLLGYIFRDAIEIRQLDGWKRRSKEENLKLVRQFRRAERLQQLREEHERLLEEQEADR